MKLDTVVVEEACVVDNSDKGNDTCASQKVAAEKKVLDCRAQWFEAFLYAGLETLPVILIVTVNCK